MPLDVSFLKYLSNRSRSSERVFKSFFHTINFKIYSWTSQQSFIYMEISVRFSVLIGAGLLLLKKFIKDFIRVGSSNRGFGLISSKKEEGNCIFLPKNRSALLIFKAE